MKKQIKKTIMKAILLLGILALISGINGCPKSKFAESSPNGFNESATFEKTEFCVEEGKEACSGECCEGLTKIKAQKIYDQINPPKCVNYIECPGAFICSKCSNFICENNENSCNCPEDCKS